MSEIDWIRQESQREADTKNRAYQDRRQRWVHQIQSTPVLDLAVIRASAQSMRRLAQEIIANSVFYDWHEVEHLAMDYLTNAIHAGACGGVEWLEWRMRLGGKPHISNAMLFLSKYAPPMYSYPLPTANGIHAKTAAEINTVASVIDSIAAEIEKARIAQPATPIPPITATPTQPTEEDHLAEILQAMLELGAFDQKSRKPTRLIARKAVGPGIDPAIIKRSMSSLRKRGEIVTKLGRTGGAWLTEKGREAAERLKGNK